MKVEICGKEMVFPVDENINEKEQYESLTKVLSQHKNVSVGNNVEGPWCEYRNCNIDGNPFQLVYDSDDDETYITSAHENVLEKLKAILFNS